MQDFDLARAAIVEEKVDIVVLDYDLPHVEGVAYGSELCGEETVGIIVIISEAPRSSRAQALKDGADAVLVQPVPPSELTAQVRSLLRRILPAPEISYRMGDWIVDFADRTISHPDGREIPTTAGEFDLLRRMIIARGEIVTREELIETIRRRASSHDVRSVDVMLSRLRKKLTEAGEAKRLWVPVWGFGYRLAALTAPLTDAERHSNLSRRRSLDLRLFDGR